MLKYDQGAATASWLQLALCGLAVSGGTFVAAYLCWKVHWIAAVVVVVYMWILLADVCVTGRQSRTWYLLDFMHHLLSFAGTAIITSYLCRIDWRIGVAAILPVLILLLTATGFLILRLYDSTSEARVAKDARKHMHE